jgi:hypothetical protein
VTLLELVLFFIQLLFVGLEKRCCLVALLLALKHLLGQFVISVLALLHPLLDPPKLLAQLLRLLSPAPDALFEVSNLYSEHFLLVGVLGKAALDLLLLDPKPVYLLFSQGLQLYDVSL